MKFVIKSDFIDNRDVALIKLFKRPETKDIENQYIENVNEGVKGWSALYDFSKTDLTKAVTKPQGDGTVVEDESPEYYKELGLRIASDLSISSENMFFQYIKIGVGGEVQKHYDVRSEEHTSELQSH